MSVDENIQCGGNADAALRLPHAKPQLQNIEISDIVRTSPFKWVYNILVKLRNHVLSHGVWVDTVKKSELLEVC